MIFQSFQWEERHTIQHSKRLNSGELNCQAKFHISKTSVKRGQWGGMHLDSYRWLRMPILKCQCLPGPLEKFLIVSNMDPHIWFLIVPGLTSETLLDPKVWLFCLIRRNQKGKEWLHVCPQRYQYLGKRSCWASLWFFPGIKSPERLLQECIFI